MIGIILWSDTADRKAVIWCEDQGDLAYFSDPDHLNAHDTFFDVGDVVEFEAKTVRNMRLALNPRWIKQNAGTTLADGLTAVQTMQDHMVSNTAKVIPFRAEPTPHAPRTRTDTQKRLGRA